MISQVNIERLIAIATAFFLTYYAAIFIFLMTSPLIDNLFLVSTPEIRQKKDYKVINHDKITSLEELRHFDPSKLKKINLFSKEHGKVKSLKELGIPEWGNLRIKFPDGKLYEVPEHDLDEAIELGGEVHDVKIYKVRRPDGKIYNIPEHNLGKAIYLGGQIVEEVLGKYIEVTMPDGKKWSVPEDKINIAIARGGNVTMISSYKLDNPFRFLITIILSAIFTLAFFVCTLKLGELIIVKKEGKVN